MAGDMGTLLGWAVGGGRGREGFPPPGGRAVFTPRGGASQSLERGEASAPRQIHLYYNLCDVIRVWGKAKGFMTTCCLADNLAAIPWVIFIIL